MTYVDLHAHLDFDSFDKDRDELIQKMKEQNIIALSNTLNPQNYKESKALFSHTDQVKVCPGLYPQDAEKISEKDFQSYLKLLRKSKDEFSAIGEVGLDRHHTRDPKLWELQEQRFKAIIDLALEIDKPIIVHTRKAEERSLEILEDYKAQGKKVKVDFHCFCGKKKLIKRIKELGVYCSIPLSVLKAQQFQILVEELPMKSLLVETDSPFLHPQKIRNSPLNIPQIYEKIAQIKGYDSQEIESIIYRNYQRFIL